MHHKIRKIDVHLVSAPVPGGLADATRKVETIGFVIVRVTTDQGLEGIGITYHEAGGEATCELINRNMVPRLLGSDPLESEAIWEELFHYLRGVGRKGLMFCALQRDRHRAVGSERQDRRSPDLQVARGRSHEGAGLCQRWLDVVFRRPARR